MKNIFKISFICILFIISILFIPDVEAENGDKYKCTYYMHVGDTSVALFNVYWQENPFGKYDTYKSENTNRFGYEILANDLNLNIEIPDLIANSANQLCLDYCYFILDDTLHIQTKNSNYSNMCDEKISGSIFPKKTLLTSTNNGNVENNTNNDDTTNNNDATTNNNDANEIKNFFIGKTSCGGITSFTFPDVLPKITSLLYNILKIAIPVILVIKGMMDMFKATTAGKEDEMKKAQKKFGQRLIAGACALLAFIIIETVINFIADKTGNSGAMDCVNCFINNQCQKTE